MPVPSPLAVFLDPLERLGLPYCITGSVAASVYGEPRLTADIDVVLLMRVDDITFRPMRRCAWSSREALAARSI